MYPDAFFFLFRMLRYFFNLQNTLQLDYLVASHFGAKTVVLGQRLTPFGTKLASH